MEVKREIMKKEADENKRKVSSARFLGIFAAALMTAMFLVAVSMAPVSATDDDLEAVVRVDPATGDRTIVSDAIPR